MFEDRELSEKVSSIGLTVYRMFDESLVVARKHATDDEFKEYRLAVGHVLAEVLERVMNPIWQRHPDLCPDELNQEKNL